MVEGIYHSTLAFPKLNGENWKFNMKMMLYHEGLFGFVNGTETETVGENIPKKDKVHFTHHKQKAIFTIALGIEHEQQNLIMGQKDTKEKWDTLKEAFEPVSRDRIVHLRVEILRVKFQPQESMAVFIGRLKQAKDRMEAVAKKIDDKNMHIP